MELRINKLLSTINDDEAVFISSYPNIFYYSGFTSEDAFLLISRDKRLLITDSRYFVQAAEQASDFEIINISDGFKDIFAKINETSIGFEESHLTVSEYEKIKSAVGKKSFVNMQSKINEPRYIKDSEEINKIAEAERLGDEAFSYILNKIHSGVSEKEIAFELEFFLKKQGAFSLSFDTIAASGKRGAMPHGVASDKIIEKGDMLTLDFGCVLNGYCSDMTRTVAVGSVSDWQREIYDVVLTAQKEAINGMSLGMSCADADNIARSIIKSAGYGECFGHSLGHSLGIEIHENPNLSPKSKDALKTGNVVTVEPGIYIENMGGVRIEDVVVVTENGIKNLTHSNKELIIL